MTRTILRRLALLTCLVLGSAALWGMIPRAGRNEEYEILVPVTLYFSATTLALLAVERPTFDQRWRYPGALFNVLAVLFPISILARWVNGDLPPRNRGPALFRDG